MACPQHSLQLMERCFLSRALKHIKHSLLSLALLLYKLAKCIQPTLCHQRPLPSYLSYIYHQDHRYHDAVLNRTSCSSPILRRCVALLHDRSSYGVPANTVNTAACPIAYEYKPDVRNGNLCVVTQKVNVDRGHVTGKGRRRQELPF
jgi:hypothetical protein